LPTYLVSTYITQLHSTALVCVCFLNVYTANFILGHLFYTDFVNDFIVKCHFSYYMRSVLFWDITQLRVVIPYHTQYYILQLCVITSYFCLCSLMMAINIVETCSYW